MATSIRDLLDGVAAATTAAEATQSAADGAVTALRHVARALERVLPDPSDGETGVLARRRLVGGELAAACQAVALGWPGGSGRLVDLAAAAADAIGRRAAELGSGQRWALVTELAATAYRCATLATRFGPYQRVPELARVVRLAGLTEQIARLDPPGVRARACLDTPTAARWHPLTGATRAPDVVEAAAGLLVALEHAQRRDTLTIYAVLAASAAAETCAQQATELAQALGGQMPDPPVWTRSSDSWRVLHAALIRFDDGSRYATTGPSAVTEHAVALQRAVTTVARSDSSGPALADEATATSMRYVANQLPALAEHIETSVTRWTEAGRLLARARTLPRCEERVVELIRDRTVLVAPHDIGQVRIAARVAGRLSSALAVELDRTAGRVGDRPLPDLIRALAEQARPLRTERDARWAAQLAQRCAAARARAAPAR